MHLHIRMHTHEHVHTYTIPTENNVERGLGCSPVVEGLPSV